MDTSDLAKRMKDYEIRNRYFLQKRIPVAIRVDMRAGHTFTKGFEKPFDKIFMKSMQETAKYMCENTGNAKFAYVQSDEITIILVDYDTLETECWFNYRTDKLCSISASMATMAFNKFFAQEVDKWGAETFGYEWYEGGTNDPEVINTPEWQLAGIYSKAIDKGATFDSRCFNVPKEEVTNYFYWRQLDAIRNSINGCAQSKYSAKKLQGLNIREVLAKMESDGFNWNDLPIYKQRGIAVVKNVKGEWLVDKEMPVLKDSDRFYVDRLLEVNDK